MSRLASTGREAETGVRVTGREAATGREAETGVLVTARPRCP
jgi:hypothetical protein